MHERAAVRPGQVDQLPQERRVVAFGGRAFHLEDAFRQFRRSAFRIRVTVRRDLWPRWVHGQRGGNAADQLVRLVRRLGGLSGPKRGANDIRVCLVVLDNPHAPDTGPQQLVPALLGFQLRGHRVLTRPRLDQRRLDLDAIGLGQPPAAVLPAGVLFGRVLLRPFLKRVDAFRHAVQFCRGGRHTNMASTGAPWRMSATISAGVFPALCSTVARATFAASSAALPKANS